MGEATAVYHFCAFERAHSGGNASNAHSLCHALSLEDALAFEYADDLKHWYRPIFKYQCQPRFKSSAYSKASESTLLRPSLRRRPQPPIALPEAKASGGAFPRGRARVR